MAKKALSLGFRLLGFRSTNLQEDPYVHIEGSLITGLILIPCRLLV